MLRPCLAWGLVAGAACITAAAHARAAGTGPYDELLAATARDLAAHSSEPRAVADLAVLAGLDEDVAPAALEAAVRPAVAPSAHPLVAAHARLVLARLVAERGAAADADALRAPLGLVSRYFVIGPFGEGRASLATTFPPEREPAPPAMASRYPGKAHEVGWRAADGAVRDGMLYLDGLLRPDTQAVAYVAAFVRSDRERPAALRIGSPGPIKVWLNGVPVLSRDVVRPAALDQDAAGVRLARGWNRVLIKTAINDGAWRLYVRFTEPGGAPLRLENDPPVPPAAIRPARGPRPSVDTLTALLERSAARAGDGERAAAAWLDLGRFLAWIAPHDQDDHAAAAAFDRSIGARPSLAALLGASQVASDDDDDQRRRSLERALTLDGLAPAWRALVLARLGEIARAERRQSRAAQAWHEALALDPACWPAALALAEDEADASLALAGLARVQALPPEIQALPRVRRATARLYEAVGRSREAARVLEDIARERRTDVDLLHQLAVRARQAGDGAEARARLAAAAALRPDLPSLEIELAKLFEGAGEDQRALSTLTGLATRLPDDPHTLVALGKLLHRMGRGGEALERLRGALALRPQDPELKRYVDRLAAGERGDLTAVDELGRRFAEDAAALVPAAAAGRAPPAIEDSAVVLLDRRVVRVHRNGLSRTFAQRVVQVLTERGVEENKEFAVHYTPGTEEVDIRQARIYRRDPAGAVTVLEATDRSDEDLSEPWYGLYYDNRAEIVRFEGLRPGDVVEIQYLVDDVGSENQLADYFGDLQFIAEGIPKRRWDYTLIAPASRPINANVPRVERLDRNVTVDGDDRVYRFAARDIPKIDAEPAMPGAGEIAPYLHVSTYASWRDVATWYWHLVEEQLAPDEELRKTARGLVKPGMAEAERVRAVYNFVIANTRYVGLEFGIHGYKPYKVSQVLARRFGDCKDKASLMIALLREVGVPAELVLVRTRRGGLLDAQPASLAVFDHAIVYVPSLDRYLDGTAEFAGPAELPTEDQGVMVLRVGPRGGVLTQTPVLPSSESRVERRWQIAVEASGDGHVDEELIIHGQAAPNWREHYQSAGERLDRYGRVWSGRFSGARLVSLDMPGIGDRNAPVTVRAAVQVPRLARLAAGGTLELPVTGRDGDFVRTYARLSARHQDLVLAYPWQHDEEIVYRLPAGWRIAPGGAPAARTIDGPFGRFHMDVEQDGDRVRVRSTLDVTRARIAPADYARFRAFLGEVDAALGERVTVAPPGESRS